MYCRTRRQAPTAVTIDLDASDDPTHGQQVLTGFHGYYDQHQYFSLFAFDGDTGFPLAAWLRPGTVHVSCSAVGTLRTIVEQLRAVWPHVVISVRGDNGLAVPEMYDYCEQAGLWYAFGYTSNTVLPERTDGGLGGFRPPDPDFLRDVFRPGQVTDHAVDEAHQRMPLRHVPR